MKKRWFIAAPFITNNVFLSVNTIVAWVSFVYTGKATWILRFSAEFQPELAVALYAAGVLVTFIVLKYDEIPELRQ